MVETTRADQIRQLIKKWLETGDNTVLDEVKHAVHGGVGFNVFNRRILERYKEFGLELHAHFFRVDNIGHVDDNICAISQYVRHGQLANDFAIRHQRDFLTRTANGRQCQRSVFIDVHELVQHPEGMKLGVRLPGLVRLQTLNDRFRLNGYATESIFLDLTDEPCWRQADWKHVFFDRSPIVNENQLPHDMIERGAEVVQTLANDDAQTEFGGWEADCEAKMMMDAYVNVSLRNNTAFVKTFGNLGPYRCEMFLSPDEFLPHTVERMIHGKENAKDP